MSNKDEPVIPKGSYCYTWAGKPQDGKINPCPYWSSIINLPKQENGYCSFMEKSDRDLGCGLLWDMVKECGINDEVEG